MSNGAEKKDRGCLYYGCLTAVVVALVMVTALYLGVRKWVGSISEEYLAAESVALPAVEVSPEDVAQLRARLGVFAEGIGQGTKVEPLVLSEQDINALIAGSDEAGPFKDGLRVAVADGKVTGSVSLLLDELARPLCALFGNLKGRYLNGPVTLAVGAKDGILVITAQDLEANGKRPPRQFMKGFSEVNLAQGLYDDSETAAIIRRIEKIEASGNKLVIVPVSGE